MASKQFMNALRGARESKNLDKILPGTGYLGEGTHDVTIQAVDVTDADKNRIKVTYVGDAGKTHNEMVFLMDRDGKDMSYSFRSLLAATIPDMDAVDAFLGEIEKDDSAFEMLTGMKYRFTLSPGRGFQVRATGLGGFAAYDAQNGDKLTDEKPSIEEAREAAEAQGMKRSYLRINKAEATNVDENIKSLLAAVAGRNGTAGNNAGTFSAGIKLGKAV